ncbi:hypothetical protein BD309DRAFT_961074 [Dichomitus squalens]|nr:hypothetical protein BD309DRAFT_961074 [Dichomitus squalens]
MTCLSSRGHRVRTCRCALAPPAAALVDLNPICWPRAGTRVAPVKATLSIGKPNAASRAISPFVIAHHVPRRSLERTREGGIPNVGSPSENIAANAVGTGIRSRHSRHVVQK